MNAEEAHTIHRWEDVTQANHESSTLVSSLDNYLKEGKSSLSDLQRRLQLLLYIIFALVLVVIIGIAAAGFMLLGLAAKAMRQYSQSSK